MNLTLAPVIQIERAGIQAVIDLREQSNVATTLSSLPDPKELDEGWKLPVRTLVLAQTAETVELVLPQYLDEPAKSRPALAARVEGKSLLARFGVLVHFTAPTIHAGWRGPITLEIMSLGRSLMLYLGMQICQLILEEVVGQPVESESQFQDQRNPAGAR